MYFATVSYPDILEVFDMAQSERAPAITYKLPNMVDGLCVFPTGNFFLVMCSEGVTVVSRATGQARLLIEKKRLTAFACSNSGRYIAVGDIYGEVQIYELPVAVTSGERLKPMHSHKYHTAAINCLAFEVDDMCLLSGGSDELLYRIRVSDGVKLQCCEGHDAAITCCAPTKDLGVITGGAILDFSAKLWNLDTGAEIQTTIAFSEGFTSITSIAVLPTFDKAYLGYSDGSIALWDLLNNRLSNKNRLLDKDVIAYDVPVAKLCLSRDATYLLAGIVNGTVHKVNTEKLISERCWSTFGSLRGLVIIET